MRIARRGAIALIIAVLELAFLPILLDIGGSSIGIIQLMVYAFAVGSVASLLVSYKADRFRGLAKIIRSRKALAVTATAGVLNYGITQILLTIGTLGTNPSISSVVFRSWVLMLAIMIPFTLRNRINRYQLLASAVGFIGVFIMATGGTGFGISTGQLPFILIILGSAFAAASSNLIIKIYSVSTVDSVAIFNMASLVFVFAVAAGYGIPISLNLSLPALAAVLFLGIITYTLGGILYFYSFKTLNTVKVANALLAIPFISILFSFILLGTPIEAYYLYAGVLIAVGIVLQQKYSANAPEYIKSKEHPSLHNLPVFDVTSAFVHNETEAIRNSVGEGKRALAIKIDRGSFLPSEHGELFERHRCIAFTNNNPHPSSKKEEIEFITETTGPSKEQDLLICLGNPRDVEDAFAEFASATSTGYAV